MIPLPSLTKRAFAGTVAVLLGLSMAQAGTVYSEAVNTQLQSSGKNIQTASSTQLLAAMNAVIAAHPGNAGEYLHDVLLERSDRNTLASGFTWGAIQAANVGSNPLLTGSIVGRSTAADLQDLPVNPLKLSTVSTVSSTVIKKVPVEAREQAALKIGASVSGNLSLAEQTAFSTTVAPTLLASKNVLGAFVAGVSTVGGIASDYTAYAKTMAQKYPSAAANICYAVLALSGDPVRIQTSGSFATTVSADSTAALRGSIAQGIVKAAGTANTAAVINAVLESGRGKTGKEVLLSNLPAFTSAVSGAVTMVGDQAQTDLMRSITSAIASGTYSTAIGKPAAALTDADKAKIGAAAVRVAPVTIASGNHSVPVSNPANAAVEGILSTGISDANLFTFALTVAKGAKSYENVGQVGNAIANQMVSGTSLNVNGTVPPAEYLALSGSLIKSFPSAAAEISRRIAELIPANDVILPGATGTNQAARINFAKELATRYPASASNIAMGIVKTDPNTADTVAAEFVKLNKTAAVTIVTKVANSVPAEEASEIAFKMGGLLGNKTLALSQAGAITKAIASGALVKTSGSELPVIAAQMIGQLMSLYTPVGQSMTAAQLAQNKSLVTAIGTVAQTVARVAFGANINNPVPGDTEWTKLARFADQIAGSAAQLLTTLGLPQDQLKLFIDAISTKVQAVVPSADGKSLVRNAIERAKTNPNAYEYEVLMEVETPVTNY